MGSRTISTPSKEHKLDGISPPIEFCCNCNCFKLSVRNPNELGIDPVILFFCKYMNFKKTSEPSSGGNWPPKQFAFAAM